MMKKIEMSFLKFKGFTSRIIGEQSGSSTFHLCKMFLSLPLSNIFRIASSINFLYGEFFVITIAVSPAFCFQTCSICKREIISPLTKIEAQICQICHVRVEHKLIRMLKKYFPHNFDTIGV